MTASPTPVLLARAGLPPTEADLSETVEVRFTEAIRAKAEELKVNPVRIYNWVRNNIEFVPTYGSIQGADMCLKTRQCNAFDTASLLIAL
ncbi:MAG: transglutaminase domain-containing protein, partial [Nitrospirae bacterium]|nr:transglutaminase domain-containing protein [Nitrospirota bacterium]